MQGSLSHSCELPLRVGPDCSGGATFRTLLLVVFRVRSVEPGLPRAHLTPSRCLFRGRPPSILLFECGRSHIRTKLPGLAFNPAWPLSYSAASLLLACWSLPCQLKFKLSGYSGPGDGHAHA